MFFWLRPHVVLACPFENGVYERSHHASVEVQRRCSRRKREGLVFLPLVTHQNVSDAAIHFLYEQKAKRIGKVFLSKDCLDCCVTAHVWLAPLLHLLETDSVPAAGLHAS